MMKNGQRQNNQKDVHSDEYNLNFFLGFKKHGLDSKFIDHYFLNQQFFIEIYLVFLLFIMIFIYSLRKCIDPASENAFNCTHKNLFIFSFFSLVIIFGLIKNNIKFSHNPFFLRFALIPGTLYLSVWFLSLEIKPETMWLALLLLISVSNFVLYVTWKHHFFFTIINLFIVYVYLAYIDVILYRMFLADQTFIFQIIGFWFLIASLLEKMYKELWGEMEFSRKIVQDLEKFIEECFIPVLIIDENKRIILINRYCSVLLDSLENGSPKGKTSLRSYLHRTLEDFFNENDLEFLDKMVKGVISRNAIFSRIFVLDEAQTKRDNSGLLKDRKMRRIISDLTEYVDNESNLVNNNLFEISTSPIVWKSTKCVLVLLKPLENLQAYLHIKRSLESFTLNNLYALLNQIEEENFKVKSSNLANLTRPPSLYLNTRKSLKANNFDYTPAFLEMNEIRYGMLISQELNFFLQHRFPPKTESNFRLTDFLLHFIEIFNNIANAKARPKSMRGELHIMAEKLIDLPDIIKGDCERLEEVLAFLILPLLKKFGDLVKITITCDYPPNTFQRKDDVQSSNHLLFSLEIQRKDDDQELENFLRSQIFAYARKEQQEIYERIKKTFVFDDFFLSGLNLLPFILKILDNDSFDIESNGFITNINFTIPFIIEERTFIKSPANYLHYNEINLDPLYHIVQSKKKKGEDQEFLVFSMEKKSIRSFEDLGFVEKPRVEPSSSDSIRCGGSSKSSPLKKHKNHKILREDLLKMVSPDSSYHSSTEAAMKEQQGVKDMKSRPSMCFPLGGLNHEPKFCSHVFEFEYHPKNYVEFKPLIFSPGSPDFLEKLSNSPKSFHERLNKNVDHYLDFLQEKYKETLAKTIFECLRLRENISLNEIHEELFRLLMEDNKQTIVDQRRAAVFKGISPKSKKKKNISHNTLKPEPIELKASEEGDLEKPVEIQKSESAQPVFDPQKTPVLQSSPNVSPNVGETLSSSFTERRLENQLEELFQGFQVSSIKMEEMEEIKEEMEFDYINLSSNRQENSNNNSDLKPSSTKTSPHCRTLHPSIGKSKLEKVLISPINRPLNILKLRKKDGNENATLGKYTKKTNR